MINTTTITLYHKTNQELFIALLLLQVIWEWLQYFPCQGNISYLDLYHYQKDIKIILSLKIFPTNWISKCVPLGFWVCGFETQRNTAREQNTSEIWFHTWIIKWNNVIAFRIFVNKNQWKNEVFSLALNDTLARWLPLEFNYQVCITEGAHGCQISTKKQAFNKTTVLCDYWLLIVVVSLDESTYKI